MLEDVNEQLETVPKADVKVILEELHKTQHELEEQQLKTCQALRHVEKLEKQLAGEPPAVLPLPEMTGTLDDDAQEVLSALRHFFKVYHKFKARYNLPHTLTDRRDIALGVADKAGRVVRIIKHNERQDHMPNWEQLLQQDMFGTLAYLTMAGYCYDLDWKEGVIAELKKAVEQHAVRGD